MSRAKEMRVSGWGNYPREVAQVYRPEKQSELACLVGNESVNPMVARGLGRSYGDAALNSGGALSLCTKLNRLLDFDTATGLLECEGGTSIEDILQTFVPRGFFPPVTPGTKYVTVGGAIAADAHGKNHHRDGSIAEFVEEFELLIASGERLACSRQQNADAFWATLGGMGLTGIILKARLRLRKIETSYIAADYHKAANLDQALALFAQGDDQFQYSVAWIDCLSRGAALGRSVLIRGNHANAANLPPDLSREPLRQASSKKRNVPFNFPGFALSPLTVKLFNARFYAKHENRRKLVHFDEFFYPLDSVLHWNRIYGKRGFFQYQAVFAAGEGNRCLRQLLERLVASGRASFLAVLKTMGKPSGGMLSFPIPGQTLALDLPYRGSETVSFLQELDRVVLDHGGRVYLAKDAAMTADSFHQMYPRLGEFNAVKKRLDPHGRFSSSQSRRLKMGEAL